MDFFEEQAQARKRTARLGGLFVVAVVGIAAAVYLLTLAFWTVAARDATGLLYVAGEMDRVVAVEFSWWNPGVLLFSVIATAIVIGLGSLYKMAQLRSGGAAVAVSLG